MESTDTKEVILEGFLAEKYGRNWKIRADTYSDIFACIDANYPGFRKDIIDLYTSGGDISIKVGEHFMEEAEEFLQPITKDTIIIAPIPAGSKSGPAKVLTAIAMVAFMVLLPPIAGASAGVWGAGLTNISTIEFLALNVAVNLAMVGLQQMLAPDPSVDQNDTNYLFNGPENTTVSGNPVPILCGEMIVGGIVISSGSVGGFHANEATFTMRRNIGSGVTPDGGASYTGDVAVYGGGEAAGVIDTFFPANTEISTALQDALQAQRLGVRALGTDNYVL